MNDGVIQQAAPPLEVYNDPANTFVAGFIGSPPMNFLELSPAGSKLVDRAHGVEIRRSRAPPPGARVGARARR